MNIATENHRTKVSAISRRREEIAVHFINIFLVNVRSPFRAFGYLFFLWLNELLKTGGKLQALRLLPIKPKAAER